MSSALVGLVCSTPTRRDEGHPSNKPISNEVLSDEQRKAIYEADLSDVRRCRIILLNFGSQFTSLGTLWEAGSADAAGKHLVIVTNGKAAKHPFIGGCGAAIFETLDGALHYLTKTFGMGGIVK